MSTATSGLQQIVDEIDAYIRRNGGTYSAWYIGIAASPRDRLFTDHNVSEHGGLWIYRDCGTDTAARSVEQAFLKVGCQGGGGGGDRTTRYVYAYKITSTTRED